MTVYLGAFGPPGRGAEGRLREKREGGHVGVHQFHRARHHLGDFRILGHAGKLILPQIQVLAGQRVEIGRFRHGAIIG
ncbi:MAG: hypothetical protein WD407_10215 [Rhodospirillales bacterium]